MKFIKYLKSLTQNARQKQLASDVDDIKNILIDMANNGEDTTNIMLDRYASSNSEICDALRKIGLSVPGVYIENGKTFIKIEWN